MTGSVALSLATFAGRTGRGVRIAVVDSGIHAAHPHVGGVSSGVAIDGAEHTHSDTSDRLGHGTAVAAAIREKAPDAVLIPVKVFDRSLATTAEVLAAAIRWSAAQGVALVNLSLGTSEITHRPVLEQAIDDAVRHGSVVVAAAPQNGIVWLPGALSRVVAVEADWACARDAFVVTITASGAVVRASGFPRPIPGVETARNFKGASFAVANATGLLALAIEGATIRSADDLARCF